VRPAVRVWEWSLPEFCSCRGWPPFGQLGTSSSYPFHPRQYFCVTRWCWALMVNLSCALMLTRYRHHAGSLTLAAFLSARNDTVANIAIVSAGVTTIYIRSAWPDLIVGLGIAAMNADAAREIYTTARVEHRTAVR
jgi:Co/Zn/Cd efflux system component